MNEHTATPLPGSAAPRPGSIVVGYDTSPSSLEAVRRGVALATDLHRDLRVVMAWTMPISYSGLPFGTWSPQEDAQQMLAQLVATVFPGGAPDFFSAVTVEGDPARVLIEESVDAEMLLVGSRGHGGFVGLLLGSVSSACAEHAACPVLIMRAPGRPTEDVVTPVLAGAAR